MKLNDGSFQFAAFTSISGAILTWWPVLVAIPGALYYIVLLIEKVTGKSIKELLTRKNKDAQS